MTKCAPMSWDALSSYFHILESIDKDYWDEFLKVELIILQDEIYSREFEGFIKRFFLA